MVSDSSQIEVDQLDNHAQKISPPGDTTRLPEYVFGDIAPVGDRWFALRFKCTAPHPDASPEAERSRTTVRDALLAVRREFFETGSGAEWLGAQASLAEVEADMKQAEADEVTTKSRWSASIVQPRPEGRGDRERDRVQRSPHPRRPNVKMTVTTLREVVQSAEIKAREDLARLVAEEIDSQRTVSLDRVKEAETAMSAALAGPLDEYEAARLQWSDLDSIVPIGRSPRGTPTWPHSIPNSAPAVKNCRPPSQSPSRRPSNARTVRRVRDAPSPSPRFNSWPI